MPEGPEVKIITDNLQKLISNQKLLEVNILSGRYTKSSVQGIELLNFPNKCQRVYCKGKLIIFELDNELTVWNTLGMSGKWTKKKSKHARVEFVFENNTIYFDDVRNFGTLKVSQSSKDLNKKLKSLGPDMLSEEVLPDVFLRRIKKYPLKQICQVIMDQKIISGVGNYIKAEALYDAKISPMRMCGTLSYDEIRNLQASIVKIMKESYRVGGNSLKNYNNIHGKAGHYVNYLKVYGKEKDPDGRIVIKTKTADGRTTSWVPTVQK